MRIRRGVLRFDDGSANEARGAIRDTQSAMIFARLGGREARGSIRYARGALRYARGVLRFARGVLRFARGVLRFARGVLRFARGAPREAGVVAWLAIRPPAERTWSPEYEACVSHGVSAQSC